MVYTTHQLADDVTFVELCRERDASGNLLTFSAIQERHPIARAASRATIERTVKRIRSGIHPKRHAPPRLAVQALPTSTSRAVPTTGEEVTGDEAAAWCESGDTATLVTPRGRITTLDALLAAAAVDLAVWEVERWVANKWEVGAVIEDRVVTEPLWQVKAWLRRIKGADALREIHDALLADIEAHAPAYPVRVAARQTEPYLLEISPADLHVGKLAWGPEVDDEHYDSTIAGELLHAAMTDLLAKAAPFRPERILFPVGNDLLHTDGPAQTTTGGTPQDADTRHARMFQRACRLMIAAIDRLELVAPVDVVIVPGNHDRDSAFKLGEVLAAWYRNCDRVTVDNGPTLRKYVRWGACLIGFTHGSEERHADLPLIMANERPDDWAATSCHEWHLGHYHTRRQTRFVAGDTVGGVGVKILPSLSGTDAWHYSRGYVKGPRAAEAYLWHKDTGYAAHFSHNFNALRIAREAA